MNLRNTLNRLVKAVIAEAERNPDFEAALNDAMSSPSNKRKPTGAENFVQVNEGDAKRGKNRRAPAVLDPVQVVRDGEVALRNVLGKLSLEQLRNIIAEYGMDPARLVMKWNTSERVIDRIVEMSIARANKGSAFRKPFDESSATPPDAEPADPQNDRSAIDGKPTQDVD